MATIFNFNGRQIIEPGSYAQIISSTTARATVASYGNTLIIDTGVIGKGFGVGAGINGELNSGKNSIYAFDSSSAFKKMLAGGSYWDISDFLFVPSTSGNGINRLFYVKAATTTAPTFTYTFTGAATTPAIITTTLTAGAITSVTITNGGVGYTSAPILTLSGGTPTTAGKLQAVLTNGVITSVNIITAGVGYSSAPTVAIADNPAGGSFTVKVRNEGISGNGLTYNGNLIKGIGVKMIAGVLNPASAFILQFYSGNYRGVNILDIAYNTVDYSTSTSYSIGQKAYYGGLVFVSLTNTNLGNNPYTSPTNWQIFLTGNDLGNTGPDIAGSDILLQSPEFTNLVDLITWMKNSADFAVFFYLSASSITGAGGINAADLVTNINLVLAAGGTETYNSADVDSVLSYIDEEDFSFILPADFGVNATSATNTKILGFLNTSSRFERFMYVAGGYDKGAFTQAGGSIPTAQYFNNEKAVVIHSGIQIPKQGGGTLNLSQIYHAALVLGCIAGLEPQVPGTWKPIRVTGLAHALSPTDRVRALQGGVLHTRQVDGKGWVINQAINSIQRNTQLINPDASTFSISVTRIKAQLNKELILNSSVLFVGGNLASASAEDIKVFTEGLLLNRTVRPGIDNLIISFQNVKVTLVQDAWFTNYGFIANSDINKLFFTGALLDANISI